MEALHCSSCGASDLEILDNGIAKCGHCGSLVILPKKKEDIVSLLNSAYVYRKNNNYDLAIDTYKAVLDKDDEELSALEGLLLAEYGIEYVKDTYTGKYIPTCHRMHFQNIYENETYLKLISLVNDEQKSVIEKKAKEINSLQAAIEKQVLNEKDYDIFISYKSSDKNGDKTEDSVIARQIYDELSKSGYRVFFAEKTLEDKVGSEYEPIIFKALHTSKIFLLVGTSKENIESPWVRNEWSRFIERIRFGHNEVNAYSFIPVFKGMNPYDMPKINGHYAQGIDASKIGYVYSVVDGVDRIYSKIAVKKTLPIQEERKDTKKPIEYYKDMASAIKQREDIKKKLEEQNKPIETPAQTSAIRTPKVRKILDKKDRKSIPIILVNIFLRALLIVWFIDIFLNKIAVMSSNVVAVVMFWLVLATTIATIMIDFILIISSNGHNKYANRKYNRYAKLFLIISIICMFIMGITNGIIASLLK
ncbi:MAG: TIR domain-containing protein [Clostridia bacterium]|nr:TIR domain-containing protein [Clostridia bacterium]